MLWIITGHCAGLSSAAHGWPWSTSHQHGEGTEEGTEEQFKTRLLEAFYIPSFFVYQWHLEICQPEANRGVTPCWGMIAHSAYQSWVHPRNLLTETMDPALAVCLSKQPPYPWLKRFPYREKLVGMGPKYTIHMRTETKTCIYHTYINTHAPGNFTWSHPNSSISFSNLWQERDDGKLWKLKKRETFKSPQASSLKRLFTSLYSMYCIKKNKSV